MFMFLSRYWWVLVVRGSIAILFGVLAFALPLATLTAVVLVFGAFALADGIFAIVTALAGRTITTDWWILFLQGVLGIGIGAATMVNPAITAVALLVYIAVWAIVAGVLQVAAAIRLRRELTGEWWLVLGGILGAAFGVAMLWAPGAGALALLWMIASYAIITGVMLMIGGFDIHRARRQILAS